MSSDTRLRIVTEAARLFDRQGFAATSVADVLEAAGVNSGSLYHFFPGKGALLAAVLDHHRELLRPTLLEAAEQAGSDPGARVLALAELYRRSLAASGCTRGCPVGRLALELGDREPQARALIDRYFAEWVAGVDCWLRAAEHRLPEELDHGALAQLVLAVIEGALLQAVAGGRTEPFDAAVAALGSLLESLADTAAPPRSLPPPGPPAPAPAPALEDEPSTAAAGPDWRSW